MVVVCCLCRSLLQTKERRKLHSDSTKHVVPVLLEFAGSHGTQATRTVFHPQACLCRSCLRSIEKLQQLRDDLQAKENQIKQQMGRVLESHGLASADTHEEEPQQLHTPRKKRSAAEAEFESPCGVRTPKRRCYDTPTRESLKRVCPTGSSPAVAVLVKGKKARVHTIPKSSGLKKLAKGVARRNRASIGRQAVRDPKIRERVLSVLTKDIQKEMTTLCARNTGSILRQSSLQAVTKFSWDVLAEELQRVTPTLYTFLKGCVDVKRRAPQKSATSKKQKSPRTTNTATLGICASILLRHKNVHMNTLQRLISLILHSGHSSKQVYVRLQKLLLCLSRHRTLTYLDKIGEKHDAKVLEWCANIEDTLRASKFVTTVAQDEFPTNQEQMNKEQTDVGTTVHPSRDLDDGGAISDSSKAGQAKESSSSSSSSSSPESNQSQSSSPSSPTMSEFSETSTSSLNIDDFLGPVSTARPPPALKTYRLVGDNIDKQVNPRDMRSDNQTRSLHYFHTYAVRDRIDLTGVSDQKVVPDLKTIRLDDILPTSSQEKELRGNFSILFARMLKKHMPFFAKFGQGLERHIRHEFYSEMSEKSEVVPLGIELKSEQKLDEMVQIMASLHKYVPIDTATKVVTLPDETTEVTHDDFFPILLGGDQMTTARVRGSQRITSNSDREVHRLQGLVGVTEDWHTKMCFLVVIWQWLYRCSSGMDGGTLFQLRNLINRRNIVKDPSKDMNACEDFFELVVESHILAAAMAVFRMSSVDGEPCSSLFPGGSSELDSMQRRKILLLAVDTVVDKFADLQFGDDKQQSVETDKVQAYAREVLSLGLLYLEFTDAIREGDGSRILRCWQYFLLVFKATNHPNYAIEAFTLLVQEKFLFSPRMSLQLKWNRTVNTHGRPGKNIPGDLHLEHLNRECKNALSGLGSNITDKSVKRVGRCIGKNIETLHAFDKANGIRQQSGYHTRRSSKEDMKKLLKQLTESSKVFETHNGRSHKNFPSFSCNVMRTVSMPDLKDWMSQRMRKIMTYSKPK